MVDRAVLVVVIYVLSTAALGFWTRRLAKDVRSFAVAGSTLGPFMVAAVLGLEFIGMGPTVGTAEKAFKVGISACWYTISVAVALVIFAFTLAPRFRKAAQYTVTEPIRKAFGDGAALVTSVLMIYALFVLNISMYVGGAAMLATLLGISVRAGLAMSAVVTTLYVVGGGLFAVGYTNLIHGAAVYIGCLVAMFGGLRGTDGVSNLVKGAPVGHWDWAGLGLSTIVAWWIADIGKVFSTQFVIQGLCAARDERAARRGVGLAALIVFPVGIISSIIGIAAKNLYPSIDPKFALPTICSGMRALARGVTSAGLTGALFCTISGSTLACGTLFFRDVYCGHFIRHREVSEREGLIVSRIATFVVGLLPAVFGAAMPEILRLVFFAGALRVSIAVLLVALFYFPGGTSSSGALWALASSGISTTIWFLLGDPFGIDNIFVALVVPIIVLSTDWLVRRRGIGRGRSLTALGDATRENGIAARSHK